MIDFKTFEMTWKPNQFLHAPEGYCGNSAPHSVSESYKMPANELLEQFRRIALATPRVELTAEDMTQNHLVFVAKSRVFRFPDVIDVQVIEQADGHSALAIYSRAKLGIRDFGVNKARIKDWLSQLKT